MRAPYIPSEHAVKGLNAEPSAWIKRFCPLFSPNAKVLDIRRELLITDTRK